MEKDNAMSCAGEPIKELSIERLLEIMGSLKRYDEERATLVNMSVNREEPVIKGLPSTPGPESYTLFGLPVYTSNAIPPGYGMGQTSCGCSWGEIERDGGGLLHMAKRHTVIIKFDES